ncbi:MAG: hypothetical protein OXE42_09075, partial [Gammaproteobacteria bacterium]|nr:hypothetical protein [Gammaproteobacteria bacterium]
LGRWAAGPLGRWAAGPLGRWANYINGTIRKSPGCQVRQVRIGRVRRVCPGVLCLHRLISSTSPVSLLRHDRMGA